MIWYNPKIRHKKRQRHHSDRFNPKVAKLEVEWKDNQRGTLPKLLKLNESLRTAEWPYPFNNTAYRIREADARNLEWISSCPNRRVTHRRQVKRQRQSARNKFLY